MSSKVLIVLCCVVLAGGALAQDQPAAAAADEAAMRNEYKELLQKYRDVQKRLELNKNEEVAELQRVATEANKALQDRIREEIKKDPEGAEVVTELDALQERMGKIRAGKFKQGGGEGQAKDRPKRRKDKDAAPEAAGAE